MCVVGGSMRVCVSVCFCVCVRRGGDECVLVFW